MIHSGSGPTVPDSSGAAPRPPTPALDRLLRWQHAGGTWEVIRRSDHEVTIALCRCDGGEEADRFTSADPTLLAYLGERDGS